MKFLLVNKFHYLKGGSERYYFNLSEILKKHGNEVIYFAMKDEKNISHENDDFFVNNVSKNGSFSNKLKFLSQMNYSKEAYTKIKKLIRKEKPDVAILNLVHKQISLSIIDALKEENVKIIWVVHDLIMICPSYTMLDGRGNVCEKCLKGDFINCVKNKCIDGSLLKSFLSYREAMFIKKHKFYDDIDTYICPSKFYMHKLIDSNFTKANIVYMANPLPYNTNFCLNENPDDYVLYFGRLSREKGVDDLIKVCANNKIKFYVVGEGPFEDYLKKYASTFKHNGFIKFFGFKKGEELKNLIFNSKVVALPSKWYENGPFSAIEAMAMGKPLIVSNLGGLPELVIDNKNGYVYKNLEELQNVLNEMFSINKEAYQNMCKKSLEIAKNRFNPELYYQNLIKIIEIGYKKLS